MSITIKYTTGRFGNHVCQYAFARLMAEKNNIFLNTDFTYKDILGITNIRYTNPALKFTSEEQHISDIYSCLGEEAASNIMYNPRKNKHYILNGSFEYSKIFNDNESQVKSFFKTYPTHKNKKDIVAHIRLGDTPKLGRSIHPDYFLKILEKEQYEKLYIVSEKPKHCEKKYYSYFSKHNPIFVSSSLLEDFNFIRSFDKIICSNSTMCWWACFLSDAKTIYTPSTFVPPYFSKCKESIEQSSKMISHKEYEQL